MRKLSIRRPDDWHVHFRDGDVLQRVAAFTASVFKRAVVMPNLTPPVTTAAMASDYRQRIMAAVPPSSGFIPLMTCYLTDNTDPQDLVEGNRASIFTAAKLYPAHATTNSHFGVTAIEKIGRVLEAMAEHRIPLLVHGEIASPKVDVFDREKAFIDAVVLPTLHRFPALRVILEHVTTAEGVEVVRSHKDRMGATITPQHLLFNRNALFEGGIRPHMYCLPVLKRERHQHALRAAATSGEPSFFLGTDSAPHMRHLKEHPCGCAGVFSAPSALQAYLRVFSEHDALEHFEAFASLNGPAFYGLEPNDERIELIEGRSVVPASIPIENLGEIVPLFAGEAVDWTVRTVTSADGRSLS